MPTMQRGSFMTDHGSPVVAGSSAGPKPKPVVRTVRLHKDRAQGSRAENEECRTGIRRCGAVPCLPRASHSRPTLRPVLLRLIVLARLTLPAVAERHRMLALIPSGTGVHPWSGRRAPAMIAGMETQWWDALAPAEVNRRAASINRELWALINEQYTDTQADAKWRADSIRWGIFDIPDAELGALGDVAGLDLVELGCGTAFFSASLARAGGRPIGVDVSSAQLATARRCQRLFGPEFPLVNADATAVPLASASCDLVVSEYGASLWCDADGWIGEAARLLRPGGRLVFLTSSPLVTMCVPEAEGTATRELQRGQREIDPVQWAGGGVEFHPGHGELIAVLRRHGFIVHALHELYAPPWATTHEYFQIADPQWARQWPAEDLWVAGLA